jgi:cell shape-determining protein MreC
MVKRALVALFGVLVVSAVAREMVQDVLSGSASSTRNAVGVVLTGLIVIVGIFVFVGTLPKTPEQLARAEARKAEQRRIAEEQRRWWNSLSESERQNILSQQAFQEAAEAQSRYWEEQRLRQQHYAHQRDQARAVWLSGDRSGIPPTDYFG